MPPRRLDRDDELAGSFDEIVIFLTPIAQFQGLDVLLVPNELAQITLTSYLDRRDVFPVPYCIGSSREDWAVEATRKLIQPLLLQRTLITKRLQENEVREILRSFVRKDPTEPGGRPKLTLRKKI